MKAHHHIFAVSVVISVLPPHIFDSITSMSPIIVLLIQMLWFFLNGFVFAEWILKKNVRLELVFIPLLGMIIGLNLNYFFGKSDALFVFKFEYIVFFTSFIFGVICVSIELLFKKIFQKLFSKKQKPST